MTRREILETRINLYTAKKKYLQAEHDLKQDELSKLLDMANRELMNLDAYGDMAEDE